MIKKYWTEIYKKKREQINAYHRALNKTEARREYKKRWRIKFNSTIEGRRYMADAQRKTREKNPIKHKARSILRNAVISGKIERSTKCEKCKREVIFTEGHHIDYTKPLEVIWLCKKCHRIADDILRNKKFSTYKTL